MSYATDSAYEAAMNAIAEARYSSMKAVEGVVPPGSSADREIAHASVLVLAQIAEQIAALTAATRDSRDQLQAIASHIFNRNQLEEQKISG